MPRRVSQVSTERIFNRSMPASSMMRHLVFGDLLVRRHQHLAGVGIEEILERRRGQDAVAEPLDDLAAFDQRGDLDPSSVPQSYSR